MVESHPTRDIGYVFVGRQREMAELMAALDDALGVLKGEPRVTGKAQQPPSS